MFENIIKGLRKDLIGKEFIYVSKYGGETKGIVKDVSLQHIISFDEETARKFKLKMASSGKFDLKESDLIENNASFTWSGKSFKILVHTTNNVFYELGVDNIYFLDEK